MIYNHTLSDNYNKCRMGASGAGKTTLLDVLAQRKTIGVVEGTILLDGQPLQVDYERLTGYVEQMGMRKRKGREERVDRRADR